MLHTLIHSPAHCDLETLLLIAGEGDDLLLLQDGVLAALAGSRVLMRLSECEATLWVLAEDVQARGLTEQISTSVQSIDYTGFVTLTSRHQQQMVW
ncbi:sulfurtransferase complex subunit TusB [Pantoea sp. Bo_2]|uniref:Protein TusB n=1 Tax=Candidatus Pantoea gossypiicola TaxID=2608008 RepID=A0AB34CIM8_9GAMM|nr:MULTISPECIES: sulfurtransferase complex subunit TusB [Pantoea]KAA5930848.1 sulfurtransferase complex subunit TusB [Pantoea sp. VH_8]KAA5935515.1 sulfurtransferase complex subunit TusB [Pantoea sp. VH_4]KAA5948633.1 sulfurtransferase complex subunit TusB [Pantoea sp. VH_3]KAA5955016.1 sulfurtransferase complex subunit TusB [Pantoea sp. VH_25]KAA5957484.1 sulfurtransferase complex subunit TusB [Pantoea sp. VH_24]